MHKQIMICSPTVGLVPDASRAAAPVRGAEINFAVQPIIDRAAAQKVYSPLTDFITQPAGKTRGGQTMLKHIGFEDFEPTSTEIY